jgi:hypothetical protein
MEPVPPGSDVRSDWTDQVLIALLIATEISEGGSGVERIDATVGDWSGAIAQAPVRGDATNARDMIDGPRTCATRHHDVLCAESK